MALIYAILMANDYTGSWSFDLTFEYSLFSMFCHRPIQFVNEQIQDLITEDYLYEYVEAPRRMKITERDTGIGANYRCNLQHVYCPLV